MDAPAKRCLDCGEVKPLEDFHRDHRRPDGRVPRCKPCHARKVIRGLLCDRCNRGLGYFADDARALTAAAEYVQREGVMPHAR